jgi:hydroxyacylglutathione hydrolase
MKIIRIDLKGVNAYLLKSNEKFILVDTGGYTILDKELNNRRREIETKLDEAGCKIENLKLIILTHGDYDHTSNADYLRKKYKCKIAMHADDEHLVKDLDYTKSMEDIKFKSFVFKIFLFFMKNKILNANNKIIKILEKFTPDILIDESFSLLDLGFSAKIIHIPGHTHGSIVIVTDNGDLIAGDVFQNAFRPTLAPNAYNFELLNEGIKRLKGLVRIKTIYPGHGKPFEASEIKQLI